MPRGKKPNAEPSVSWHIRVPLSLHTEYQLILFNPLLGKVEYARKKNLVVKLLRQHLAQLKKEHKENSNDN